MENIFLLFCESKYDNNNYSNKESSLANNMSNFSATKLKANQLRQSLLFLLLFSSDQFCSEKINKSRACGRSFRPHRCLWAIRWFILPREDSRGDSLILFFYHSLELVTKPVVRAN